MVKMVLPSHPQLSNDLLQKFVQASKNYVSARGQRLAALPDELIKKLRAALNEKGDYFKQAVENAQQKVIDQCSEIINGSKIRIEIRSDDIRSVKRSSRPTLIPGKAFCKRPGRPFEIEVDCFVACSGWENLGELKEHKINLIDHLAKLLPPHRGKLQRPLGLVTFQNGIMNTLEEFKAMSQLIIDQLTEGPLCIGLHNPTTNNLLCDLSRFRNEPECNERAVYSLCQMVKTFADLIPKVSPNLVWLHLAHSEGGLIANAVFELCNQWWQRNTGACLKHHLVTATYGAVKPIPDDYVLDAINTYSNRDIALFFGKKYLDKELSKIKEKSYNSKKSHAGQNYTIRIVDSELDASDLILKIQLQEPRILTLDERLQMSWFESLAQLQDLEGSPRIAHAINTKLVDSINATGHSIKDHGFKETTYQQTFRYDMRRLRDRYEVYDSKKLR